MYLLSLLQPWEHMPLLYVASILTVRVAAFVLFWTWQSDWYTFSRCFYVIVCWRHFCVFGTSASCCQADAHRHALAFTAGDLGQTSLAFVCRFFFREVLCDMDILAVSGISI